MRLAGVAEGSCGGFEASAARDAHPGETLISWGFSFHVDSFLTFILFESACKLDINIVRKAEYKTWGKDHLGHKEVFGIYVASVKRVLRSNY